MDSSVNNKLIYYPYIDLLKFICCIGIVLHHTRPFVYFPVIQEYVDKLSPVFVSIFFVVSSVLFWRKIQWKSEDWKVIKHFIFRLIALVLLWGMILVPHWLPKFIRHNDDWILLLFPKIIFQGLCHGSWFIMALIYGVLICYILNRYLNRHLVFILCIIIWLYFSLVHYDNMHDYLGIYCPVSDGAFQFSTFFSPIRSLFWIESGYYLSGLSQHLSPKMLGLCFVLSLVISFFLSSFYFITNAILTFSVTSYCLTNSQLSINPTLANLRKKSIVIFFSHLIFVTLFHFLVLKHILSYEYGFREFFITFLFSYIFATIVVKMADRYPFLRYLF